jgi:Icc-related predicted phosphoesterase
MRLVLTSDLHGHLPRVPPCDALLIAGDLCPIENHDIAFQADWLRQQFVPWLASVPAREKIFIAGNHDFVFAEDPDLLDGIVWPGVYLQDSGVIWEGIHFWGSPWANELPGWAFTAPEAELAAYWALIPATTQVLLVHGPPLGHGDTVIGSRSGDLLHVGSSTLLEAIRCLPQLQLVVYGHIHESAGLYAHGHGRVTLVNAALMDVFYVPTNPLRTFELRHREREG